MGDINNIAALLNLNVTNNTLSPLYLGEIDILALPPDLQNLENMQSLKGQITSTNQDGHVVITTPQGDVTISTDQASRLQNGQSIELRINAGDPPTKAVLRPLTIDGKTTEDPAQRSSSAPVQTTLTQSAHEMASSVLLRVENMLSGAPLTMTRYNSNILPAQPFMSQIDTTLLFSDIDSIVPLPAKAGSNILSVPTSLLTHLSNENVALLSGHSFVPALDSKAPYIPDHNDIAGKIIDDTVPLLLATKLLNVSALPFRNIAAPFVSTSEETRVSYNPDIMAQSATSGSVRQAQLSTPIAEMSAAQRQSHYDSAPSALITKPIQINVSSFSTAQINFQDAGTNTKTQDTAYAPVESGLKEPHSVYNPHRAEHSATNNISDKTLPLILSERPGFTQAQLEGFTETRGFAVLRVLSPQNVSAQLYALETPIEMLPIGSQFMFQMNAIPGPTEIKHEALSPTAASETTIAASSVLPLDTSSLLTPGRWPVMEDVQQSLNQADPKAAQAFNAALPSVSSPAQFGAGVLLFVSAMRMGNVQSWLGEKVVDTLKRTGKSDLLKSLGKELSDQSQINEKQTSGQWKTMSVPLMWQNDIHKLSIYTHNEQQGANEDNHSKGQKIRFIVDTTLTNIGPVQLDGLFTGTANKIDGENVGHLDLVLRTQQKFSQAMKQQMRQAYLNALEETRISGTLTFGDKAAEWVRITSDEETEYSADI